MTYYVLIIEELIKFYYYFNGYKKLFGKGYYVYIMKIIYEKRNKEVIFCYFGLGNLLKN